MLDLIRGGVAMGFLVGAGFFFRFWRETRDRLFALFGVAFLLIAANSVILSLIHENIENSLAPYLIRLMAFVIICAAIIDKNLRPT